ncbi:alpha-ribazole phosphatase [Flavobacterium sp. L1I52]|uniref:Alpha-ribazole phosphatase n=1 Tax=Flavobacterium pokkalii TaxID=1940408 RepID=A0ABR7UNJ6_9FLAO|nr:alpha-ribazole phosphatase [Flavobacterium pokkalii]KQB40133.1 Phosphoglycerate mutase [Flavobacterium daejeonense]MBD0724454.1 alpha-ribazole phosphatase [Flavobacterium pokkalii]
MEIYLVRHTETICEKGICYGQSDVGLKEPFLEQFESIRTQIPNEAIVYSSPLKRCVQLADFLASSITTDFRLMEMDFGDWEMKKWDAIPETDFTPWMNDFVNVSVPNGESFVDLHHRVTDFWKEKIIPNSAEKIVIVTHAGVIRSILCAISNLPLKDAFMNKVDFGAVLKLEL